MDDTASNDLIKRFRTAAKPVETHMSLKFKIADQTLFEIEIDGTAGQDLDERIYQVIEQSITSAAAAVLVQNEIKKNHLVVA